MLPCLWNGRCWKDPDLLEVCGGQLRTVNVALLYFEMLSNGPFRFWKIFWVDATTTETMDLSLRDIATDPDARASGVERSAKSVLQWLTRIEHDWLIVFDNATGDHNQVAGYMPQGNRGNILFTSRNLSLV